MVVYPEKSRVLLKSDKPTVLRQLQAGLCSRKSTKTCIQHRLSCIAKARRMIHHPFERLLLRPQQHLLFRTISRPTEKWFLYAISQNAIRVLHIALAERVILRMAVALIS